MWSKGTVAAETAAVEVAFARHPQLRSRRSWPSWSFSPPRSCRGVLALVISVSIYAPVLSSTGGIPTLWCFAAGSPPRRLENFPSVNPFPRKQQSEGGLSAGARGMFAQLASAATAALRSNDVTASILGKPENPARTVLAPLVDGSDWHESIIFDEDDQDSRGEEKNREKSSSLAAGAVKKFTQALTYVLNSAKRGLWSSKEAPTQSTARGLSSSSMGWSMQGAEPMAANTHSSSWLQKNTHLSERPAWLLPGHRSYFTRMSVPPRESGTCPAVGGFGHPLGRRYEGLEDWGGLLCRSGGMLRKANAPDFAYDMFVLVKGYRGGDGPLEESLSSAGDGLSSISDSLHTDGISASGRRSGEFGISFDTSASGRTRHGRAGTLKEGQRRCHESSKACDNNVLPPRHRKTEAQLEDELNEVIDTLSMLYCHLANVVDLRHPSNFQLYANIRKVASKRANVLRGRNQVSLPLPDERGASDGSWVRSLEQGDENDVFAPRRFATKNNYAGGSANDGSGVMRGQHPSNFSGYRRASSSPRNKEIFDMQQEKHALHGGASGIASRTPTSSDEFSSPPGKEEIETKLLKSSLYAPKGLSFEQRVHTPLVASLHVEQSSPPAEASDDDSGPVLVVVRNLTTPERLFFGVREIKEYLFSRLLQTAYEIRAYNEFKRSLFALARQKRSLRLAKTASTNTMRGMFSRLHRNPAEYYTQEHDTAAFGHGGTTAGIFAEKTTEEQKEETQSSDSANANTADMTEREKTPSLIRRFSISEWLLKGTDVKEPVDRSADKRLNLETGQDIFGPRPSEVPPTETKRVSPFATTSSQFLEQRPAEMPAWTGSLPKAEKMEEEEPWWTHLGLRFDLYVSLSGITRERVTVSPTASLLRLVSEPRMRTLVCVYNYEDPKTDIPPILRANGLDGLPALVLGRRLTTGARSIERLLVSIANYQPPFPYSLEQYAPRFLVTEPIFSEVLAFARMTRQPLAYAPANTMR